MSFIDIFRQPDRVTVQTEAGMVGCTPAGEAWGHGDVAVHLQAGNGGMRVSVTAAGTPLQRIHLRWQGAVPGDVRLLGDHWERGYGDLEWRGLVPERVMPWYVLTYDGRATHGYGVETGPGAFAFWRIDPAGISLWLDVRNGGGGVQLHGRTLAAVTILSRAGQPGETPFQAAQAFCRQLCPAPRLPNHPVYGSNNWYYAYGVSSHARILQDTELLVSQAPTGANRPYMVIDAGWQTRAPQTEACVGRPWEGNADFPDMPGLAASMQALGSRPGIWLRPLAGGPADDASLLLPPSRATDSSAMVNILDPSLAENLAAIEADCRRMQEWGFQLIKHDWTACDALGRWGFDMGAEMTKPDWHFADRTRTTAEIVLALYRAIRAGAGSAIVIGCNTFSHLSAGLFELQRTGDDTSGMQWERTRKMGVNTLAFRMGQHDTFYAADADCVGLTKQVPWSLNRQWLDLLARSGTPLFVSADPEAVGPEQAAALRDAYARAAVVQPVAEPLDWLDTTCPRHWRFGEETVTYDWYGDEGIGIAERC